MKFIWDQYKTKLIQLEGIRNFELDSGPQGFRIIAWFNDHETLPLGLFKTEMDAVNWLERSIKEDEWEK